MQAVTKDGAAFRQHEDRPFDRRRLDTGLVAVGTFRLPVDHPCFEDSGPIREPVFVFPRTSCVIEHEDGRPFTTDTATITYYNTGQRYRRQARDRRGDLCEWFAVREDVLRELAAERDPAVAGRPSERLFPFTHGRSDAAAYLLQRQVVRHVVYDAAPDPLLVEEAVLVVLTRAMRLAPWRESGRSVTDREGSMERVAESVRAALNENLGRSLSLSEVASLTGHSASRLCRTFRHETGSSIHSYRNRLRLQRALELVAEPDSDLSTIAHSLGFSSHSHFTASFRNLFGLTPSVFRLRASGRRLRAMIESVESQLAWQARF